MICKYNFTAGIRIIIVQVHRTRTIVQVHMARIVPVNVPTKYLLTLNAHSKKYHCTARNYDSCNRDYLEKKTLLVFETDTAFLASLSDSNTFFVHAPVMVKVKTIVKSTVFLFLFC